ncbi:FLOT1 protein, partial [Hylia prasina]|nr:FLOT1 protein [Hylia prasina]
QEIYKDRQKFSDQVFRVASSDLVNMGISVVSYTLKDVHDEQVAHLGQLGTPGVPGDSWDTPGDSWGSRCQHSCSARRPQRGPSVTSRWPRPSATELSAPAEPQPSWHSSCRCSRQAARSQQAIAAQRCEVALVERAQRVQLQEQEVGRRLQELEATMRKPAEAERYRVERLAEAQR